MRNLPTLYGGMGDITPFKTGQRFIDLTNETSGKVRRKKEGALSLTVP